MEKLYYAVFSVIGFFFGLLCGVILYKEKVFPYKQMKILWGAISGNNKKYHYGPWSIGVYQGSSPFVLQEHKAAKNPVITAEDVSDVDAKFVGDPFIVEYVGQYLMFFEALVRGSGLGVISYATSDDGVKWKYKRKIIEEPFHLSYPHVFEYDGEYYLIPESYQDKSVRLYRATSFPDKWEYSHSLISGYSYMDPTVLSHGGKWWLFVSTPDNSTLNLYYSDDLHSGWKPHPKNPIVKNNLQHARMAGPIFKNEGILYRFSQSALGGYGKEVYAFEIKRLSIEHYEETLLSDKPLITGSGGQGWNSQGMHHLGLKMIGERWIAIVDGRFY